MAVKFLVSAAVAGLLLSGAMGAAPVATQEPLAVVTDSSFVGDGRQHRLCCS